MKSSELSFPLDECWSEAKQNRMSEQFVGVWAHDLWDMKQWALADGNEKSHARPLKFACTSRALNIELKYACWQKFASGAWSTRSWNRDTYLNRLVSWLNHVAPEGRSLLEESLEKRELSLRSYLAERDLLKEWTNRKRDRFQQMRTYPLSDFSITLLRAIYRQLQEAYDERDKYDKDMWDLREVSSSLIGSGSIYWLNFTRLAPPWLKTAAKRYLRYRLPISTAATCAEKVKGLQRFSEFVCAHYGQLQPSGIDRALILCYLSFLADRGSPNRHASTT